MNLSNFLVNETAVNNLLECNVFLSSSFVQFLTETLKETSKVYEERLKCQIKHAENNSDFQVNKAIFHLMLTYRTF